MAHFAELDSNNIVLRVIVVNNSDVQDETGTEVESIGVNFLVRNFGGTWVQTSINNRIRKRYACVGFLYDSIHDVFIPPQPYPSWKLNEITWDWDPPVVKPENPTHHRTFEWNEEVLDWKETTPIQPPKFILIDRNDE